MGSVASLAQPSLGTTSALLGLTHSSLGGDGELFAVTTSTGFPGSIQARLLPGGGLELTYKRVWLRTLGLIVTFTSAAVTLLVYALARDAWTSLRCVRHRIESNSTYHLHEDTDCFLKSRSAHDISFELSNATTRSSSARRGAFEVWLEGPRLDSTADDHLWLVTTPEDAATRVLRVRTFLRQTKTESGFVQLRIDDRPSTLLFLLVFGMAGGVVASSWLVPFSETLTALGGGSHALVLIRVTNAFGFELAHTAVPMSDVSCCAVDHVVYEEAAPESGGFRVRRRLRREWSLGLCLLDAARTRVPLLLGDASRKPDSLNLVASKLNRVVLAASLDMEKAAQDAAANLQGASGLTSPTPSAAAAAHTLTSGGSARCVVCLTNPVAVALLPCRHVCACVTCSRSLSTCPICRVPVQHTMRMYVS